MKDTHLSSNETKLHLKGVDRFFLDIGRRLPRTSIEVIFDVGANVGQTYQAARAVYPGAKIHAFEPVPAAAVELGRVGCSDGFLSVHQLALGASEGVVSMIARGTSTGNAITDNESVVNDKHKISVICTRGDKFCSDEDIPQVDVLKIDTEGHDLEVLKGFEGMLSKHTVSIIQVEASMNLANQRHVRFCEFSAFLENLDYHLFYIYNQFLEKSGLPLLRRADPVFISRRTATENAFL